MIKSVRMRWAGHDKCACWCLVEKRGGRGSLEIHKCWRENYFKIYFIEIELEGVDLICVANDGNRWQLLVNTIINCWFNKIQVIS